MKPEHIPYAILIFALLAILIHIILDRIFPKDK